MKLSSYPLLYNVVKGINFGLYEEIIGGGEDEKEVIKGRLGWYTIYELYSGIWDCNDGGDWKRYL